MTDTLYSAVCQQILGPAGSYWPEWGDIQHLYCKGLHASYYAAHKIRGYKTIYKYCNGTTPLPNTLVTHYAGTEGYVRMMGDVTGLIAGSVCMLRLLTIHRRIHDWVRDTLTNAVANRLEEEYVQINPTEEEIMAYLASVLHYAVQAV